MRLVGETGLVVAEVLLIVTRVVGWEVTVLLVVSVVVELGKTGRHELGSLAGEYGGCGRGGSDGTPQIIYLCLQPRSVLLPQLASLLQHSLVVFLKLCIISCG